MNEKMKIVKTLETDIAETPHGVAVRPLFSNTHATFVHINLEPGESLKKHITPVDAFFYGLSGKGVVEIGDETREIVEGDLVFSPAKIVHRLSNPATSSEPFSFLVVKAPTPTTKTQVL
ncbi:MAG: cupin domain-containing protein [Promethearchaeota archaeon]